MRAGTWPARSAQRKGSRLPTLPHCSATILPALCKRSVRGGVRSCGRVGKREGGHERFAGVVLPRARNHGPWRGRDGEGDATHSRVERQPSGPAGRHRAGRRLPHPARARRRRLRHHLSRRGSRAQSPRHHQGILPRRLSPRAAPPHRPRRARRAAPTTTSGGSTASSRKRRRWHASSTPTSCASTATSAPTTPATWCCTSRRAAASRPGSGTSSAPRASPSSTASSAPCSMRSRPCTPATSCTATSPPTTSSSARTARRS